MRKKKFKFYALKLCFWMFVIFLIQLLIKGFTELFLLDNHVFTQVWRFLTAIFLHGSFVHLLYNSFALALFGSILEKLIGGRRFLFVFFAAGILANIVSVNFYDSSLGASGAIFGVIGALILVRPMLTVWAFGLPMPIFVAGIIWAAGDLLGAIGYLTGNPINDTGNIAHLSGLFVGLLMGIFYRKRFSLIENQNSPRVLVHEGSMRAWEDRWIR